MVYKYAIGKCGKEQFLTSSTSTAARYERAGFGRPVQRGSRPAVVVVDFSNGFTDPAQPTGAEMSDAVWATAELLEQARAAELPIVFTTIAYDPGQVATLAWLRKATGMAALTYGSRLVELDARLGARSDEHVVVKAGASAFFGTDLAAYLVSLRVDTVIVAGATTSGCVRASVVDAVQHGFPVLVPRDCVADRARPPHEANLFDIQQKYGDVVDRNDVLSYVAALPRHGASAPRSKASSTTSPEAEVPMTTTSSNVSADGPAEAVPGKRFASPFAARTPEGAEGWESLYPYYALLSDARRESDDGKFWFFDGMHNPEPLYPFDTIMTENWWVAVSQMSTRVWPIPMAGGIHQRIINGYLYISPDAVTDPDVVARRAEEFAVRAGHYYENWDEIYEQWVAKATDCIERLKNITFAPLPEREPKEHVFSHRGLYSSYDLLKKYGDLINNLFEMGSYHFEMLNLGYGAYLTFREFCQAAFPGITDQTVASMVSGIDILLFRPDDEVRALAKLAVELELSDVVLDNEDPEAALAAIADRSQGRRWLDAFEEAKDPWFWFSTGPGYQHSDRAWMDDFRLPFAALRGYVTGLLDGADISRPLDDILAERDRVTREYRNYLPTEDDRASFDDLVGLARKVFPFVENHNFYVEHWHHSMFWSKVRELGDVFVAHGILDDREDIFYLHRNEIYSAIYDLNIGWATNTEPRGATCWPPEVARRRRIRDALKATPPQPAFGVPPEHISEPLTVMLWGIDEKSVRDWLGSDGQETSELTGVAASAGRATGTARVITDPEQLHEVRDGDVLVCRVTAPSWAPVFSRLSAAISDVGGIMAHTAIVCREYGLPSVVGTGFATTRITSGQLIEVDGDAGVVRVLEDVDSSTSTEVVE